MLRYRIRETERSWFPRPEHMPPALHTLLIQRGISSAEEAERFLNPSAEQLRDPMLLNAMVPAVERIRAALKAKEKICVYGDYDVDGVSASALLADYLRGCGADTEVYLPSRHTEGYGLNEAAVRALAGRCSLMITVDCGVTSVELIALAKSLGMDCIVTDHHQPAEILPDCPVVNPLLNHYPFPSLCGAGVAFKLVQALGGVQAAMDYVDIAALATVADVVPLTDENRVIVRLGLERINRAPRPGMKALIEVSGLAEKKITAGNIAFQLGPRLNAGGRLGSARRSHDLLLAASMTEALPIAAELEEENQSRKQVEQAILADAERQLEDFDFPAHRALVIAGKDWNSGVIGLAASRLVEKYHYPTILLAEHDGVLTGSCRSIPGVDIHAALTAVQQHLTRFGGHKQAAGLTMDSDRLDAFRADLDRWLAEEIPPAVYIPDQEYDMEVSFDALTEAFVSSLDALQPTGFGNPAPVLRARPYVLGTRAVGLEGAHLSLTLSESSVHRNAIFFRHGELHERLPDDIDILFTPKINVYMGRADVQLELKCLQSNDLMTEISAKVDMEDELQHEFLTKVFYNKRINFFAHEAKSVTDGQLADMLREQPQGTIVLTADLKEAARIAALCGDLPPDLFIGGLPEDRRAFNALCVYPEPEIPEGYRRVVLAGYPMVPPLPDGAELYRTESRPDWLQELPDVDQLREVYKTARRISQRPIHCEGFTDLALLHTVDGQTSVCCAAALLALNDLQLIGLELNNSPVKLTLPKMQKTDPETSSVWRELRSWKS